MTHSRDRKMAGIWRCGEAFSFIASSAVRELGGIKKVSHQVMEHKNTFFIKGDKGFRKGVWGITIYQRVSPE